MPLLLWGGSALFAAFGYAADKTGEGVNDASTGLVKIAIASAVIFYVAKKSGVLK